MKKLATLFRTSMDELKDVRSLAMIALFGGMSVVMGYFTIQIGDFLKIGFSTIVQQFVYYLFGPGAGMLFAGAMDLLKFAIKPTGAFFPGYTFNAMLAAVLYGYGTPEEIAAAHPTYTAGSVAELERLLLE